MKFFVEPNRELVYESHISTLLYRFFPFFHSITTTVAQTSSYWSALSDFPGDGRTEAVSFTLDGKGYFGLGKNGTSSFNDFWKYDPETDQWMQIADFGGVARTGAVAFALDGKAYVGLGLNEATELKDFWVYDPSDNTWSATTDFAGSARNGAVSFVNGGKGLVLLGSDESGYPTDVWAFDPSTEEWESKNTFAEDGRVGAFVFPANNTFYIGSGMQYTDFGTSVKNTYIYYKPETDTWDTWEILPSNMQIQENLTAFGQDKRDTC